MLKEIFLAPAIAILVLGIWHFKLEVNLKKALRKYLEKKAEKETAVFIDPRQ